MSSQSEGVDAAGSAAGDDVPQVAAAADAPHASIEAATVNPSPSQSRNHGSSVVAVLSLSSQSSGSLTRGSAASGGRPSIAQLPARIASDALHATAVSDPLTPSPSQSRAHGNGAPFAPASSSQSATAGAVVDAAARPLSVNGAPGHTASASTPVQADTSAAPSTPSSSQSTYQDTGPVTASSVSSQSRPGSAAVAALPAIVDPQVASAPVTPQALTDPSDRPSASQSGNQVAAAVPVGSSSLQSKADGAVVVAAARPALRTAHASSASTAVHADSGVLP